ncbi:MAG: hypothetical protein WBD02_00525 [Acidimicrobiia bacterium]
MTMTNAWLTRQQLIEELDALIWVDERCFALDGRMASRAAHHAWRAAQLRSVRPFDVHAPDGGLADVPMPDSHARRVSESVRSAVRAAEAPEHLATEILPAQLEAYATLAARLDPIRDAPVSRMLRIVSQDLSFDLGVS